METRCQEAACRICASNDYVVVDGNQFVDQMKGTRYGGSRGKLMVDKMVSILLEPESEE